MTRSLLAVGSVGTGELFVDLAPAGLSARPLPCGSAVQVAGRFGKTREGAVGFLASTIRPAEAAP